MKFKTTKKFVMDNAITIEVGYCELQNLLQFAEPVAYTAGVYGWNADIYQIGRYAIVTGYKPFGNLKPSWKIVDVYNNAARHILKKENLSFENKKEEIQKLLQEFIEEVKKEAE